MSAEEWRWIPGYEGMYKVSDAGRVMSFRRRQLRLMAPQIHPTGYRVLKLKRPGEKPRCEKVHQLVALAFVGPRPEGAVVRHLNGDPLDNHPDNLLWGTLLENSRDMILHGTRFSSFATHCKNGHEFTPENTRRSKRTGHRSCGICQRASAARWRAKNREQAA